jgi:CheY-like chemotaxis protein
MKVKGPIIIVDDDDDDHTLLREIFENLGVGKQAIFFHDGYELLDYMKSNTIHPFIILCDINMPPIDGLELRDLICKDEHLKKMSIPYIFFSTAANPVQVAKAYDLTVQGFFLKARTFQETQQRIKLILDYWTECRVPSDGMYVEELV